MTQEKAEPGPLILVIEDVSPHSRELIEALDDEGYRVNIARDAEAAIRAVESNDYAAVLLDIELPLGEAESPVLSDNMSPERAGLEVFRHIRKKYGPEELPVIVISGLDHLVFWPTVMTELTSEELRAAEIIEKPKGLRPVIRALSRITGRHGPLSKAFDRDKDI